MVQGHKEISEMAKTKAAYKQKMKELKEARKLKSWSPYKVYTQTKQRGGQDYAEKMLKKANAKKAAEIAKILRIPDTTYIEFILNEQEPSNITISEFVANATNNKYRGLASGLPPGLPPGLRTDPMVGDYLPSMIDAVNSPVKRSKTSNLRDLIPMLNELHVETPSRPMFSDMISDYTPRNTRMYKRKDELAEYMDKYAQLTNDFNTSKINFENKLNLLKENWGDNLGIGEKEREEYMDPFLRDTIPLMEVKSEDYVKGPVGSEPTGVYKYPRVSPKYSKFKLNPDFIE